MILYRTADGWLVEEAGRFNPLEEKSLDELLAREDLETYLASRLKAGATEGTIDEKKLLAPVGNQEVWAAGVTYLRSRAARMEESKDAGGGDFYDRVYSAERPELFFKALAQKVVGPGAAVGIRSDATWNVPEPELALVVSPAGKIVGRYDWERHELAGYRGTKSAVSAAGQGLQPELRAGAGDPDHEPAAADGDADCNQHHTWGGDGVRGGDDTGADEAQAAGSWWSTCIGTRPSRRGRFC